MSLTSCTNQNTRVQTKRKRTQTHARGKTEARPRRARRLRGSRRRGASYLEAGGEGGGDGAAEQGPRDAALRGHLCTSFLDFSRKGKQLPERGGRCAERTEEAAAADSGASYIGGGECWGPEAPRVDLTQRRSNGPAWKVRTPRCFRSAAVAGCGGAAGRASELCGPSYVGGPRPRFFFFFVYENGRYEDGVWAKKEEVHEHGEGERGKRRQAVSSAKVRGAARGIDAETRTSSAAPRRREVGRRQVHRRGLRRCAVRAAEVGLLRPIGRLLEEAGAAEICRSDGILYRPHFSRRRIIPSTRRNRMVIPI
jgi:hypothetical protein